ncbi:MAG TPA: TonB family protein [Bryobacteraceae bacterium]|nr:TonB family protein [Bryobacteraceae bacterium]
MSLSQYMDGAARTGKRPGPLAVSLVLHGVAFFVLMHAPEIKLPEQSKSEYRQAIEGHETKLVWYEFKKDLPDVKPLQAKRELKPLRAERRAPQQIVASRTDAPKRPQIIQTDAPELKETKAFELPNVLAVRLPQIARPFVAPAVKAPPVKARVTMPADAPQLTQDFEPVKLADASKITRRFVRPPEKIPVKIAEVAPPPEAPAVEAVDASPALNYAFKAPPRPFTAPPRATPVAAKTVHVDAPPALAGTGAFTTPNDLTLLAVSLNPTAKSAALPASSSPGQFSAGPKPRAEGADSAGDSKGITVPDLYVAGNKSAKPDLIAQIYAAPTSQQSLRAAARLAEPRAPASGEDLSEPAHPGAVKVSNGPDKRFDGRDVYMMAIQMPNLTSYSGSWLMWYADRTARETGLGPVAPPVAHRKVDPKYIAAAAADKIEGKVQLACVIGKDGHVSTVELLRGLDERLNQSAEEALSKWEFTPATRRGEPVEVDVVVEIPFRLAPHAQVPF